MVDKNKENLDTILQEAGICHLYEKVRYRQTGRIRKVNDFGVLQERLMDNTLNGALL